MVPQNVGPAEMLTFGILVGAMGLGLVVGIVYKLFAGARSPGFVSGERGRAEALLNDFSGRISLIEHKQRVLSVYTNEYFTTFHEAGWGELQALIENLRTIETSLRVMCEQRRFRQVVQVCQYLLGSCSPESARAIVTAYEGLSLVANWREESRVILLRLIQATTTSAEKTAEFGVTRKRMTRRPTLLSLAELRDSLGDF
ncbi:MAG: hypothetical protein RIS36_233 [Pseudomonadota bacterium]